MNKKVLVVVLVLVLAVGSVFAAKSDMKVGAQLGYGGRAMSTSKKGSTVTIFNNGFYGAFTFEYGVTDAISVKAEAGINTMGNPVVSYKYSDGSSAKATAEEVNTPVNFAIFVGAIYNYAINKEFIAYGGAGLDVFIGSLAKNDDGDSFNVGFGLGLELGASYKINKQFSVNVGGKFGWHFLNTNEDYSNGNISNLTYKAYAGVTYSL